MPRRDDIETAFRQAIVMGLSGTVSSSGTIVRFFAGAS